MSVSSWGVMLKAKNQSPARWVAPTSTVPAKAASVSESIVPVSSPLWPMAMMPMSTYQLMPPSPPAGMFSRRPSRAARASCTSMMSPERASMRISLAAISSLISSNSAENSSRRSAMMDDASLGIPPSTSANRSARSRSKRATMSAHSYLVRVLSPLNSPSG